MLKKTLLIAFLLCSLNSNAALIGVSTGFGSSLSTIGVNTISQPVVISAASLSGLDTVILHRSVAGNSDLADFVFNGGTLITEWSSSQFGLSLLGGSASNNFSNSAVSNIVFTSLGLNAGLGDSIGNFFNAGGGSQFFQNINSVGSANVFATRNANGAPAILGGQFGSGFIWVNAFDWQDNITPQTLQLLDNQINAFASEVPEPSALALLGLGLIGMAFRRKRALN